MLSFSPRTLSLFALAIWVGGTVSAQEIPTPTTTPAAETDQTTQMVTSDRGTMNTISDLVDRLPAFLANTLPGFDPKGSVQFYTRPHLGDFFKSGYIRLPIGVRAQLSDRIEANADIQTYASHGLDTLGESRRGVSSFNVGGKIEHLYSPWLDEGYSMGFNYRTPLGRPPLKFTDGYRHFQPYVSVTRLLIPKWQVLGYSSVGVNLIQRYTGSPSNFGKNQLHGNALAFVDGVTRKWKRFQASLTLRYNTTGLITDEFHQNFQVRPEIVVPLRLSPRARTQVFVTLDARAVWGPDGTQTGAGAGFRVQFHLDRSTQ